MLKKIDFGLLIVVFIFAFVFILPEYKLPHLSESINHFRCERGDKSYNITVELTPNKVRILDSFEEIEEIEQKTLQDDIKDKKGLFIESIRHRLNAKKSFNIKIRDKRTIFLYVSSGFYDELYVSEKDIEPSTFLNLITNINENVTVENKDNEKELYSLLYVTLKGYLSSHKFLFFRYNVFISNPDGTYSIFFIDYEKYGSLDKFSGFGNCLLLKLFVKEDYFYVLSKQFQFQTTIFYRDNPFINTIAMYLEKDKDTRISDCIEANEYQNIGKIVDIEDFKKTEGLSNLVSFLITYLNSNLLEFPS